MTFLLSLLAGLGVACLLNLAALYVLSRLRGRWRPLLHSVRPTLGRFVRRWPFLSRLMRFACGGHFLALDRCQRLVDQGQDAAAVEEATLVLQRAPRARGAYILRGHALRQLGRHQEALRDLECALALPEHNREETRVLHYNLCLVQVALGDIERALNHACARRATQREGLGSPAEAHPGLVTSGANHLRMMIEAHDDLAEDVINTTPNFAVALGIYARKAALQEQFRTAFGLERLRTLYLPDDWVRNIGHLALLDFWAKMERLGWGSWDQIVLLAPTRSVANASYVEHWKPYFAVVSDPHLVAALMPLAQALGNRVASLLKLPDGQERYFCEGMGLIQEEWERQGRAPLLQFSAPDRERGRQCLARLGLPPGAWFVCLHVRSPGYHREGGIQHQAHRNADITSYLPAMRDVVARGGWVIRLGDPSMGPLPPLPGVIDYAHSQWKSDWMDVFLVAHCRFFVGVASGLSQVPTTFGVPSVLTNWVSNHLPVYGRRDRFVLKLHWSEREQRLLSFDEALRPEIRRLSSANDSLQRLGLRVLDNSAEEIQEVVQEMFEALEGAEQDSEQDRELLRAFQEVATRHGLAGYSRIGRGLLRKYADLLAPRDGAQPRAA